MRVTIVLVTVILAASVLGAASAGDARTTRILQGPHYYGTVITMENGVRVYRPLPSTDRVIINPNGRTPLLLQLEAAPVSPETVVVPDY